MKTLKQERTRLPKKETGSGGKGRIHKKGENGNEPHNKKQKKTSKSKTGTQSKRKGFANRGVTLLIKIR